MCFYVQMYEWQIGFNPNPELELTLNSNSGIGIDFLKSVGIDFLLELILLALLT